MKIFLFIASKFNEEKNFGGIATVEVRPWKKELIINVRGVHIVPGKIKQSSKDLIDLTSVVSSLNFSSHLSFLKEEIDLVMYSDSFSLKSYFSRKNLLINTASYPYDSLYGVIYDHAKALKSLTFVHQSYQDNVFSRLAYVTARDAAEGINTSSSSYSLHQSEVDWERILKNE